MPRNTNQLAALVVKMATGQPVESEPKKPGKDPAAVALGRKGGLIGGKHRWKGVSKNERKRLAQEAARARWKRKR